MKKRSACGKGLLPGVAYTALLAASAPTALAQHAAVEAPNVAILGSYVDTDDARGVDEGIGLQLSMAWGLTEVLQLLDLIVLVDGGRILVTFTATQSFDEIRIGYSALVGALSNLSVYQACVDSTP